MLNILLVSPKKESLSDLASGLASHADVGVLLAESGKKALEIISDTIVHMVIADQKIGDMTGLQLAGKLLKINPMINCAIVSPFSAEAFHEASEGLGIMAQLPVKPGKKQAEELLTKLKKLQSLQAGFKDLEK